ncbi:MAG: aminopeptidase P family protein [Candidatus Saccharimonadales bacterium]
MTSDFFTNNRRQLIASIDGGVAVVSAYTSMQRRADMSFQFEQESNFWYLTGIESPDWWVIIDGVRGKSWLVSPSISQTHQIFDGSLTADDAIVQSGVDGVLTVDEAEKMLRDLGKKHSVVYTLGDDPHAKHYDFTLNPAPNELANRLRRLFTDVRDCRHELATLRSIKQPIEIAALRRAIDLTIDGFEQVKRVLPDLTHEFQVEAEFSYHFRRHGAIGHAYDPIVAAAGNACTLHYVANDDKLAKGQLLLLDVGARHGGYAADITRTYAIGKPTKRQQQVYAAVLAAQQAIIELIQPDLLVADYQRQVDGIMKQALLSLGLMQSLADDEAFLRYFPHAISHGLGIDVHDSLGAPRSLQSGMVLTVEPGIYIPEESIGVRIEDDILVTPNGQENLSARLSTDLL